MSKQTEKKNYSAMARAMIKSNASVSEAKQSKYKQPVQNPTRELVEAIIFALIAALFLKSFVVEAYRIPSGSMEKTLLVGDFLFVNKFIYGAKSPLNIPFTDVRLPYFTLPAMRDPQRGDVIVFIYPGDRDERQSPEVTNYIKRCVGTPGDSILIKDKILYVNGQMFFSPPGMQFSNPFPMPKDAYDPAMFPHGEHWNRDNYGPLRIPKKGDVVQLNAVNYKAWEIFIEREGRTPSLKNGIVYIDGKQASSYTVERNYYFMMGDNRDNSEDSRYWGFVPDDNIVGEAMLIYLSWNPNGTIPQMIGSIRWKRIGNLIW